MTDSYAQEEALAPVAHRRLRLILSSLAIGLLTLAWLIETGRAL